MVVAADDCECETLCLFIGVGFEIIDFLLWLAVPLGTLKEWPLDVGCAVDGRLADLTVVVGVGFGIGMPVMKGCLSAALGFIRFSGSHIKHLVMKSMKGSSSLFSTDWIDLEFGRRLLPLLLMTGRGAPVESYAVLESKSNAKVDAPKNILRRELFSTMYLSGTPSTSIKHASCSCSFSPGKIGYPV